MELQARAELFFSDSIMRLARGLSGLAGRPLQPCPANAYLLEHARLLDTSLRRLTGRSILPLGATAQDAERLASDGEIVVVSHGVELPEPVFNYATRAALELWELDWEALVSLPSSRSAEPLERTERQKLLDAVRKDGYVAGHSCVRISSRGTRFVMHDALIWDVRDDAGTLRGQACTFARSKVVPA